MAKQLHVIHRHTSATLNPGSGSTDNAKLALGEIAIQHNVNDPAIWIKVGTTSASTDYVKFTPATSLVDSVSSEGGQLLEGDVLFASGTTATTSQVTEAVNFKSEGGKMTGNIILDKSLNANSTHAVVNSAVTESITALQNSAHTHSNKSLLDTYTQTEANLEDAVSKKHSHSNKSVLDGITSAKVTQWDSAFTNMLTGVTHGTDGTFVTTTVGDKSNKSQSIGVAVTTAATSAATSTTANGLATAYETKQYIDSKSGNIKNVTTIDGQAVGSSADTLNFATGNSLVTKSTAKSGNVITTTIGVTTGTTSSSTPGLAVNTDVKDYVDKATITGDGFVIGASGLSVSHKAYNVTNTAKTASPAHGGTFVAISDIQYDGHGHVSAATATTVTLPSETTLSTGTSGSGNVVTGITVDNHKVTKVMGYAVTSASGDDYISANATNGALTVQLKSVADTKEDIAGASATGSVADAKAVKDYVEQQITSSVQYCGATATLPTSTGVGDLYIASAQIAVPAGSSATGAATTAETGDYLISRSAGKWDVIEKNLTGAVTAGVALTSGAIVVGNGNQTVKVASATGDSTHGIYIDSNGKPALTTAIHDTSTTLNGHYTPSSSTTKSATTNYAIAGLEMDAKGHVTGVINSAHKVEKDVPSTAVFTDQSVTDAAHHYTATTATHTGGTTTASSASAVKGITYDDAGHIVAVTTGSVLTGVSVSNKSATIPVNSDSATTLATVAGTNITAKASMQSLTIAGANSKVDGETFDGTTNIDILVLDCGEY